MTDIQLPSGHTSLVKCVLCQLDQPQSEYSAYTKVKNGERIHHLMRRCRSCQRKKVQEYRHSDIDAYNKRSQARRIEAKLKAINHMGGKCKDCSGVFHHSVYDFHHLDPLEKDISPSNALRRKFEWAKEELDKCVLLCANCHRIRHYE